MRRMGSHAMRGLEWKSYACKQLPNCRFSRALRIATSVLLNGYVGNQRQEARMNRILPVTSMAALMAMGCARTTPPTTRPSVVPVADPALYACAQRTAYDLGFDRQMRGRDGRGALLATTDTNHATGRYDGLRVRVLSDTGHVTTWLTASPYTEVVNHAPEARPLLPSRRAIDAAAVVERRCRPGRVAERGRRAPR